MRSREPSTTESRQPTVRALPMYELGSKLREPRASDVRPGGQERPSKRPAVPERGPTLPLPRPAQRAATVTQLHGPGAPITPRSATQASSLATPLRSITHASGQVVTPQRSMAPNARPSHAPCSPPVTPRSLPSHAAAAELSPAIRAYVDPANITDADPLFPPSDPAHVTRPRPAITPYPTPTPLVEVRSAPVLHFKPIEKAILILAGFSVIAVVISTLFHG